MGWNSARIPLGNEASYLDALKRADGSESPASVRVRRRMDEPTTLKQAVDSWLYRTPIDGSRPGDEGDDTVVDDYIASFLEGHADAMQGLVKHVQALAPTEAELEQYFESHQARYRDADLITFHQVYFDPDLRDEATLEDAARILAELQAASDPGAAAQSAGDRLMSQSYFRQASRLEVQRQLGSGFADAVMKLAPGQWRGPVLSGYGVHLIYVHEVQHAPPAVFEAVQQRVLEDWQQEQQEKFNAEFYSSLASRYDIVIAEPPAGSVLEPSPENPAP